jgi:hypothetical protein
MKTLAKYALVGMAVASSGAYAAIDLPNTGNGELVLFVRDLSAPSRIAALELGINLDSILNQTQITATPTPPAPGSLTNGRPISFSFSFTSITDSRLATFLAAPSSLGYEYAVIAGDSIGTSGDPTDAFRLLTTSATQFSMATPSGVVNQSLTDTDAGGTFDTAFIEIDAGLTDGFATDSTFGVLGTSGYVLANGSEGLFPAPLTAVGTAVNLYVFSTGGSNNAALARVYQGNDLLLSANGTLSVVPGAPPAVPLPAAVWLLGSALAGFGAISRRRQAAQS